jgi:glycerol-3-phosphate dehydrogenase
MRKIVAVIGAGRMGSAIAKQLPKETQKIIIDRDLSTAKMVASEVIGEYSSDIQDAKDADIVLLVLPAFAVQKAIETLASMMKSNSVIVNLATGANIDKKYSRRREDLSFIDAKIIGNANALKSGEPCIVVIRCDDLEIIAMLKKLFPGFYKVEQGDASLVETINTISAEGAIKTAISVKKELEEKNIPEEWITVSIGTVCTWTMKSFINGDLGHFALNIVKRLESG